MQNAYTSNDIFDEIQLRKPSIEIDGIQYWIVEGDLLLDRKQLWAYARRRATAGQEAAEVREGLVGMTDEDGRMVRWRRGKVLTYIVRRHTFSKSTEYHDVVQALAAATNDWSATCGVSFRHLVDLDNTETGGDAVFDVIRMAVGDQNLATAFFPSYPVERRHLFLYPGYFAPTLFYDRVGILRHELGHILGFRHEHIASGAPPDCPEEGLMGQKIQITSYDPKSVMHYFCGKVGTKEMRITELDRAGARMVYGPPDHEIVFVD